MPRKLKTYQTSMGFFDLSIAIPSMKAALEAWGTRTNLFHQGFAKESDDPRIIAATMKKPGIVLQRPVGSNGAFEEHAQLPTDLPATERRGRPEKPHKKSPKAQPPRLGDKAAREAALAYEKEQRQRDAERRRQEAAEAKKRERRQKEVAKAEATLEQAEREHEKRATKLEQEREALQNRIEAEDDRWRKLKERLSTALRRAKG